VALATLRARDEPAQEYPKQAGIVLVFFPALLHGIKNANQGIGSPALALDAPDTGGTEPVSTLAIVARSLKILCRSPTGQTSGLPGSVRAHAGRIGHHGLELLPDTGSGSVSRMVLPYDFGHLAPVGSGSLAAGVKSGCVREKRTSACRHRTC